MKFTGWQGAAVALLMVIAAASCKKESEPVAWKIAFSAPALQERAAVIEALILPNGCDDHNAAPTYSAVIFKSDTSATPKPPDLSPGTYGVLVRARDASCVIYTESCQTLRFPLSKAEISVLLQPAVVETNACVSEQCDQGICTASAGNDSTSGNGSNPVSATDAGRNGPLCTNVTTQLDLSTSGLCPNRTFNLKASYSPSTGCSVADYAINWRIVGDEANQWFSLSGTGSVAAAGANVTSGTFDAPHIDINAILGDYMLLTVAGTPSGINNIAHSGFAAAANANLTFRIRTRSSARALPMATLSVGLYDGATLISTTTPPIGVSTGWQDVSVTLSVGATGTSNATLRISFNNANLIPGDQIRLDTPSLTNASDAQLLLSTNFRQGWTMPASLPSQFGEDETFYLSIKGKDSDAFSAEQTKTLFIQTCP